MATIKTFKAKISKYTWWTNHMVASSLHGLEPTKNTVLVFIYHLKISMHILHTVLYTFPYILTRRIFQYLIASLVGDHFLYSHHLKVWFRGYIVRRNYMLVTWGSKGYYQKPYNKWSDSKEPLNSEKKPHPILWNDWLFISNINLLRCYNSAMSNNLLLLKKNSIAAI